MHRPYLLFVTALLGAASLLFTALALSIPNQLVKADDPVSTEQTVRRFNDAVNLQIRTGDSSTLLNLLHPDFVDVQPLPGFAPNGEGLVDHVAGLHASTPSVEIAIESIVASGEEVVAAVSIQNSAVRDADAFRFQSASPVWSPMERYRIEGDRIIERSSTNRELIIVQERSELPLMLDTARPAVYLATHLTFEASGSSRFQTSGGPAALHVLSGELAITVTSDAAASGMQAQVLHEPESEQSYVVPIHEVVRLPQGSTVTLPEGTGFVVTPSDAAASALYVWREGVSPLGPGSAAGTNESNGVDARNLGALPFSPGPNPSMTARLHRIVLMPGALVSNPNAPDASPALMWLETGNVLTEHSRPPEYGAGTVNTNREFVSGVQLTPDDDLAYLWEPGATLHNTVNEPAVLWVLSTDVPN